MTSKTILMWLGWEEMWQLGLYAIKVIVIEEMHCGMEEVHITPNNSITWCYPLSHWSTHTLFCVCIFFRVHPIFLHIYLHFLLCCYPKRFSCLLCVLFPSNHHVVVTHFNMRKGYIYLI